jgi:hypothetical protein
MLQRVWSEVGFIGDVPVRSRSIRINTRAADSGSPAEPQAADAGAAAAPDHDYGFADSSAMSSGAGVEAAGAAEAVPLRKPRRVSMMSYDSQVTLLCDVWRVACGV